MSRSDPTPAPMVHLPAETVEKLREALAGSFAEMDPGTLRRMYGEVGLAALAVVVAATPAASVPAADILALVEKWEGYGHGEFSVHVDDPGCQACKFIEELRALVAAAEQADKGEAADV